MRLGGPVFGFGNPGEWVEAHKREGYGACYFPLDPSAPEDAIDEYARVARDAGLLIAEVGAWSNPISPNDEERKAALDKCCRCLALAERVGANCCVNIAGSRGSQWDGPHEDNLTDETFDLIVQTVREIIDAVKPTRTFYTLETMPWIFPDSPDSYVRIVRAVDRKAFGVHLDPVNLVNSPSLYYFNAGLIQDCIAQLGPHIRSCHAKDILLSTRLTVHLDEVRIGQGGLDYRIYLRELSKLSPDLPLMMEHMAQEDYAPAGRHIRTEGVAVGVRWVDLIG